MKSKDFREQVKIYKKKLIELNKIDNLNKQKLE